MVLLTGNYISERELPWRSPVRRCHQAGARRGNSAVSGSGEEVILAALEKTGGNKTEAARQLGITRKTLLAKLSR